MTAIEELQSEHEGIRLMLRILEEICGRLEKGEMVPADHLGKILEFFQVFADRCHHEKEERYLFPALERQGIPREGGPVGVMLQEHDAGRRFIQGMAGALERYPREGAAAAIPFAENARQYIELLEAHIAKENTVLFPMATNILGERVQEGLAADFDRVETERIGSGRHAEFHELLETLKGIYLT
jgi:hemerythrin-like domain-containing protein